ncbi:MAG: helix-turn-helix transcriptional regulator [Nocardioides sp.]|uniref:helix-turn-helix domain-containing protein n=1 Tax=Nocardioides sp. TaxID=35761 RepID=UPI0039E63677
MDSRDRAHTTAAAEVGRRIRDARIAQGLTQGELAGEDYSVGYVSRLESGDRRPNAAVLAVLAGRLTVSVDFLMTGAEASERLDKQHDLDSAELSLAAGDLEEAMVASSRLIETRALAPWPDLLRRAKVIHAQCHEARGDWHAAIIELEDLHRDDNRDEMAAVVGIALSRCYRESGEYQLAIETGERVMAGMEESGLTGTTEHIRLASTVAAAYFEAGEVGMATRLSRRAIDAADAISSPEAQAAAYWNASNIERHAGNVERAVQLGTKALSLLENGGSTRNLGRLRLQLATFLLHHSDGDLDAARALVELSAQEHKWSAVSPIDLARHTLTHARLLLREYRPREALKILSEVPMQVCHQAPLLSAEVRVLETLALIADGQPAEAAYADASTLLSLIGTDRGAAQLWFELGDAMTAAEDWTEASVAYRHAAMSLGASRALAPIYDRLDYAFSGVL